MGLLAHPAGYNSLTPLRYCLRDVVWVGHTMKKRSLLLNRLLPILAVLCVSGGLKAADFTIADLQKMVRELEAFAPKNPRYQYPIRCSIQPQPAINAYATAEFVKGSKDPRPQGTMVVFAGLVKSTNGDPRIIRAVVAHEISHLSNGHVFGSVPRAQDLAQFWNRAQEAEADKSGAILLQKAGYNKQDMIDMLMLLEQTRGREGNWFARLSGTHPDPKARAAALLSNPSVMRSLLSFDVGLAFMDSRDFDMATNAFDKAYETEPKLKEALINSAQCKLMEYYDGLSDGIRRIWFRPDFGPILKETGLSVAKGSEITESDRRRYAEARARIEKAQKALPGHERVGELAATAQVLDPSGNQATIQQGADWLLDAANKAKNVERKLRYANNAAIGLDRLEDTQKAYVAMISAQRSAGNQYNSALAENVGRLEVTNRPKELDRVAARVMLQWLTSTPSDSPNWQAVNENYLSVCQSLNVQPEPIEPGQLLVRTSMRVTIGTKQLALLVSVDDAVKALGQPDAQVRFDSKYPDVSEIKWFGGDVSASTSDDQILRISTTAAGSYIELRPLDTTLAGAIRIKVGMSLNEFAQILDPSKGQARELSNRGQTEEWIYYPSLSLGVQVAKGKIVGVTVTPVRDTE